MNHPEPDSETRQLDAALRSALNAANTPPLGNGFAPRVAALATAREQGSMHAESVAPGRARRFGAARWAWPGARWALPGARWAWGAVAAAILVAGIWGGRQLRTRPAPATASQASVEAADHAEQLRQLRYAVALTRAEIASITGEAVRPSLRNLSAQITRNQP